MARIVLDHWLCFDRAGRNDPDAAEGTPWIHGRSHRSGRSEPGHMWLDGLLLYYCLTGEERFRDAALQVGDVIAGAIPGLEQTEVERNLSWPVAALAALVEAGETRFRPALDCAAAMLRSRQLKSGFFAFQRTRYEEQDAYRVNTWVTAGVTVEALYRHYLAVQDLRSLDCALQAAEAVMQYGRDRESGRIFQTIVFDAESGKVLARTGRVRGGKAALVSLGAARAFELGGGEEIPPRRSKPSGASTW